jgi:subtilisin family serine protease
MQAKLTNMKKIFFYGALGSLLFSACRKNLRQDDLVQNQQQPISQKKLDETIKSEVLSTGRFNWNSVSDEMIWSALQYGDDVLSVGFKPANTPSDLSANIHTIDIKSPAWAVAKKELLQLIYAEEKKLQPNLAIKDIEAYDENVLPVIDVHVKSLSTVKLLRSLATVRYAEPMGYEPRDFIENKLTSGAQSSSGCGGNTSEPGLVNGSDYTIVAPNAKQSWNFPYHNIAGAWTKSNGSGIKVMIIDSGVSPDQPLFSSSFNSGSSSGRTIEKAVTLRKPGFLGFGYGGVETSTADDCGHGTQMAGVCAAPRTNLGNATGIAYNCNLFTVRASTDVLIDESRESKGVADAFTLAGNRNDVKIISMSMGRITSSGQISDAVDYAYNRGKLIFCAGGTSFGWSAGWFGVIFPATKSNVNAVTGVKDNYSRCNDCHDGGEIDFTVVMEKASNERHMLTTDMNSNNPSTVGGSSAATAATAGIAALVWGRHPEWTRDQVVNKMIQSSSSYPTKSGSLGWGRVNADAATN